MTTYLYLRGNLRTLRNRKEKRQDEVDTEDRRGRDNKRGSERNNDINICVTADQDANIEKVNDRSN